MKNKKTELHGKMQENVGGGVHGYRFYGFDYSKKHLIFIIENS